MAAAAHRTGAIVHVVAAALVDPRGRVLIAERPAGKALAGRWEFPGGKLHAGEDRREGLARELAEELGIEMGRAEPLLAVTHHYAGAAAPVLIDCWRVETWRGVPEPRDGQRLRWCERDELVGADILEADRPIVTALRLPRVFFHVDPRESLAERVPTAAGRERAAWLVHAPPEDAGVLRRLLEHGDSVFVLDPHEPPHGGAGSVYTTTHHFEHARAPGGLAGRVVHAAAEAVAAAALGADFLLVPERGLPAEELAGIAAAGLPWYLNIAAPGSGAAPAATGKLWWKPALPVDRL